MPKENDLYERLIRTDKDESLFKTNKTDIFLNVILPLLLGIGIYEAANVLALNEFIRNQLPDGLWAYSLTSCMLIIWNRRIKMFWIASIFILYALFESLQYFKVINGTGDSLDVLIYFIFSSIPFLTNKYFVSLLKFKHERAH